MNNTKLTFDLSGDVYINKSLQIDAGATLRILTPGTCHFNYINIESGGKLIVECNDVEGLGTIRPQLADERIEILNYNKYGINDSPITSQIPNKTIQDYEPLLEDGKTWNYTLVMHDGLHLPEFCPELPREKSMTLRIEGTEIIDGEEYFVLNEYINGVKETNNPMAYLKEDTATQQVWLSFGGKEVYGLHHQMVKEDLHYDFLNPEKGNVFRMDNGDEYESPFTFTHPGEIEFEIGGKTYYGALFTTHDFSSNELKYAMVEGIGLISLDRDNLRAHSCDILGIAYCDILGFPLGVMYPHLYEVTKADGTILYFDDLWAPGCTSVGDIKDKGAAVIDINNLQLTISSNEAKIATLYTMQGNEVASYAINEKTKQIDLSTIPTGVYILKAGAVVKKIQLNSK